MSNPVTQSILKGISDPELGAFVRGWDALEELVIHVFREKRVTEDDENLYLTLRDQLNTSYVMWEKQVEPYWSDSRVKGKLVFGDPFRRILSAGRAADFIGDWEAMRHLPAAREALNNFLLNLDS
jgi:hypothetical protein